MRARVGFVSGAEADVPGNEPVEAYVLVGFDVPTLVKQRTNRSPVRSVHEQVVPLGDDQGDVMRDGDCRSDRLLECPIEPWRLDDWFVAFVEPAQQVDVSGSIERVGSAFAGMAVESLEFGVGEVEPIHGDQDGIGAESCRPRLGQG